MFVIKQKSAGGKICIHLATSVHRPGKTPCHTRRHLGILDAKTGELLLARKAAEPNAEIVELLAKKGITYSGRTVAARGKPARPLAMAFDADVQVEEIGRVAVLSHLAEASGLFASLRLAFGADDARRLLCAAAHQVCEGEPLYLLEDWLEGAAGSPCDGVSPSSIGVMAREVGSKRAMGLRRKFFVEWIKACGMPKVLIHDTTSISTYSRQLEDAEWGYNRRESLPQMNLALVVAKESRVPIWYRTLPGSIPDVASLQGTSAQLADLGLAKFSFSLDRGYFSNANVAAMLSSKIRFTIGVPLHLTQAGGLLRRHRQSLTAFKRTFIANGALVSHVPCEFAVSRGKNKKTMIPAHLYFCQERHTQMSERLGKAVLEIADYRSRDIAEKVFDSYKNATGNKRLRTGDDESAEGRIFIAFLAVILRALMENALRKSDLRKALTVPEALSLLRKIRRLWRASGQPLLLEVPKKSREVALAMGIAPERMGHGARSLAHEAVEGAGQA